MKIKLSEIPESGVALSEPFDPVAMNLQKKPELEFLNPLKVTALFKKDRESVSVDVQAAGELSLVCGRCLEVYRKEYRENFDLGYETKGKVLLDVTNDIRQEILLTYPVRLLCCEGCLGLCSHCGKNLNKEVCTCPR